MKIKTAKGDHFSGRGDFLVISHQDPPRLYERFGGFRPFLDQYLHECITIGYPGAPLEQEAKRVEKDLCG